MGRDGSLPVGQAAVMEIEADELALELLAPYEFVRTMSADSARVASRFGIPERVAMRLVEKSPSVVTTIGVEGIFGIS
jgi:Zn-dependent peptidase ImmA (M78 family)